MENRGPAKDSSLFSCPKISIPTFGGERVKLGVDFSAAVDIPVVEVALGMVCAYDLYLPTDWDTSSGRDVVAMGVEYPAVPFVWADSPLWVDSYVANRITFRLRM